ILADGDVLLLDADDGPGHGAGLRGVGLLQDDLDFFTAGLVEDGAERRVAGQVDGERLQRPLNGRVGIVGDRGDVPAVEVAQYHRLEEVVDVLNGEGEVDASRPL